MAFQVEDAAAAYQVHKAMGVVIYENKDMNLYFIGDPDGYWCEVLGVDRKKPVIP